MPGRQCGFKLGDPSVFIGDPRMIVENLDHSMRQADIDLPADQSVRHGVKGFVDLDMIVRMDLGAFPLGIFEHRRR